MVDNKKLEKKNTDAKNRAAKKKAKEQSLKRRGMEAKKYIKDNIWKQVGKQKVYELGIIPTCLASIYYVPYWVGLLVSKAIGHNNYLSFINALNKSARVSDPIIQDALTRGDFWVIGLVTIVLTVGFLAINVAIAISKLKDKAEKKFNVSWWEVRDFKLTGDYK